MVQMLPQDILDNGVDADGDGHVSLQTSAPDALTSGARMLSHLGWRAREPWLQEVLIPAHLELAKTGIDTQMRTGDWAALGVRARNGQLAAPALQASVILPQGHKGPAFLAYPNFRVLLEWNQSFVYGLIVGYFATRLGGAQAYNAGAPDAGLDGGQMKSLQAKLQARGHDVGKAFGIQGRAHAGCRCRAEQARLGLPADAWPTPELLSRL